MKNKIITLLLGCLLVCNALAADKHTFAVTPAVTGRALDADAALREAATQAATRLTSVCVSASCRAACCQ